MAKHYCNKEKELGEMGKDIKYIKEAVDDLKSEFKDEKTQRQLNTDYRNKTIGIVLFIGTMASVIGSAIVWILSKFWGDK
jgi:hypothetical protein